MNILITAPSLNESENVSGISSLVKGIITYKREVRINKFYHLRLGKTDSQTKKNLSWLFNQFTVIPSVFYRVIFNRIDLVHLNTGLEKSAVIRDYIVFIISKRILRRKILFHIHGGYFLMQPPPKESIYYKMIHGIIKNADLTVVLSELEKREVDRTYQTDSRVLVNAVEVPFMPEDVKKEFNKPLNFIFLGRIVTSKGVFMIINCLRKLNDFYRDFHFDIYGAGPDTKQFLAEIDTIKGLSYTYHGIIAGQKKWDVLKKAHVFLLPSIHSEGLPVAILEAMAAGCISIVSNDASISTIITDKVNGYMVERGNEDALLSQMKFVLQTPPELSAISANANKIIALKHNMASYMKNLENYYSLC